MKSDTYLKKLAERVRHTLFVHSTFPLNIKTLLSRLSDFVPDASFKILEDAHFGSDQAYTDGITKIIHLSETTYSQALLDSARHRFTVCHEFGHLIMHKDVNHRQIASKSVRSKNQYQIFVKEAEADKFAAYLLAPDYLVDSCKTAEALTNKAGISLSSARVRFEQREEEIRLEAGHTRKVPKDIRAKLEDVNLMSKK